MIEVKIKDISLSNIGFVVLLQCQNDKRILPIFLEVPEAQVLAVQYNNLYLDRPLTHDLFRNMLILLKCKLNKVLIDDFKENNYTSKVFIESETGDYQVEARPSDAISMALKFEAPIYVDEKLIKKHSVFIRKDSDDNYSEGEVSDLDKNTEVSNKGDKIRILKSKLEKAVSEERYEDASLIRDKLKKYKEK